MMLETLRTFPRRVPVENAMRIRLRQALAVAGAATIVAAASSVLVPGADAALTATALVNPLSGKCLYASGSATGTPVKILTCNGGANQAWTATAVNELRVRIGGVTRCLAASGAGA